MNVAPFIFIGLLATFSMSWFAYVLKPYVDFGRQAPHVDPITSAVYPVGRSGIAKQGAEAYRAHGCATCHTQQVRSESEGNDKNYGWGGRRTVHTDYMMENPPLLGVVRLGPDLANVGARRTDPKWHYEHLYEPKSKVEKSIMPPYKYLFTERPARGGTNVFAHPTKPGVELVPSAEAQQLVAYMLSLNAGGNVFEVPMKAATSTNAPAGGTNAPAAASTNVPATK